MSNNSNPPALSFVGIGLLILAMLTLGALWQSAEAQTADRASGDIVETAIAAGSFKTLVTALQAAELVDSLKGEGPFTVFAPTDEAFAKLPSNTLDDLLKPENKEKLKGILLYHVVPGKVAAADVLKLNGKEVTTLQGGKVKINTKDGVMVNKARVVRTDVVTSNGIIHAIDTVIMPPAKHGESKKGDLP